MKRETIVPLVAAVAYLTMVVSRVPGWFVGTLYLIIFLIGVVDYYWLGGILSGRSYDNDKK